MKTWVQMPKTHIETGVAVYTHNSSAGVQDKQLPRAPWPACLTEMVSSDLSLIMWRAVEEDFQCWLLALTSTLVDAFTPSAHRNHIPSMTIKTTLSRTHSLFTCAAFQKVSCVAITTQLKLLSSMCKGRKKMLRQYLLVKENPPKCK